MSVNSFIAFLNVFYVPETEKVDKVSFYTLHGESAVIKFVKLKEEYLCPDNGEVIYSEPYSYLIDGYHSAHIKDLTLSPGYYSVVIELYGHYCTCLAEKGVDDYANYTHKMGQSYIYYNNEWHNDNDFGNVFINLYTSSVSTAPLVSNSEKETETTTETGITAEDNTIVTEKAAEAAITITQKADQTEQAETEFTGREINTPNFAVIFFVFVCLFVAAVKLLYKKMKDPLI